MHCLRTICSSTAGGAHHQLLDWFGSSQQQRLMSEPVVHLMQLSYDDGPDFRFGDVGEMQILIAERDLRPRILTVFRPRCRAADRTAIDAISSFWKAFLNPHWRLPRCQWVSLAIFTDHYV
jgi:hypothetical protein